MPSSASRRPPHQGTDRPKHPGTRGYRNPAARPVELVIDAFCGPCYSESGCNLYWRSMLDRVHRQQPAPRERRLLVRLCLFAFCGGLLLLLSSRPADAAERRESRLLDPVGTTLKATAREVDSFAGRATGSRTSTVAKATSAARQVATPHPRPATSAARPA